MLNDILLYITVFLLAAVPWVEILVVIPFGIAAGLNPLIVGILAFAGNAAPVYLIVIGYKRIQEWWAARQGKPLVNPEDESWTTGRRARAMQILRSYGVPGLALASPLLIGAHLGAVLTLLAGAPRQQIIFWMFLSLAFWSLVMTIASFYGIGWLTSLW